MTRGKTRALVVIAALVLIIGIGVSGTTAFIKTQTPSLPNVFKPSKVTCEVDETFTGDKTTKTNVSIKNTGDTDAFIRAMVIINLKDDDGNIMAAQPVAGTDYTITYATTDWTQGTDGFWYYTKTVTPENKTGVLITEIKTLNTEYHLDVQIIAQAIQNTEKAVQDAWGSSFGVSDDDSPVLSVGH